jgi:hypothetical protein
MKIKTFIIFSLLLILIPMIKADTDAYTIKWVINPPSIELNNIVNHTQEANQSFSYDIDADVIGGVIDTFQLNDTSVFVINDSSGIITNNTALVSVAIYWLNVSVNSTLGEKDWEEFFINITSIAPPSANQCNQTYTTLQSSSSNKKPYGRLCYWLDFR